MNLDSLSFSLLQINYLVTNLNKKNFKTSQAEIQTIIDSSGSEAERHLFRCLVSNIDFNTENLKSTGKDYHQTQLFKELLLVYLIKPSFASILCYSFENQFQFQESIKLPSNLASQISKILKLTQIQEISLALCLKNSSKDEIKKSSIDLLKQKIPEFLESIGDQGKENESSNNIPIEIPIDLLQQILSELNKPNQQHIDPNNQSSSASADYSDLIKKLFKNNKNYVPEVIQTLLSSSKNLNVKNLDQVQLKYLKMENSLVELVQEIGYSFTSTQEECRNALMNICSSTENITDALNPVVVARILSMMIRTQSNVQNELLMNDPNWMENINKDNANAWNLDTFVLTVQDLNPNLNWKDVVKEFDHPEFFIRDKFSLRQIMQALKKVHKDTFPIEYIYRVWKNPEGQITWISNALKNSDVFCFADFPCRRTATECLKAQPEEDNKFIASWRSLNLLEVLLNLSETGVYPHCVELFKLAIAQCSDLLLLGLLQTNPIWNKLKQELISALVPVFLGNHPNSAVLLQYAWNQTHNAQVIRTIIMNSMTDWYMKAHDQEQNIRLARILDVSQDLKALSILLNGQPLIFNIDLACLAARRGYLKLDKWMSDRIRDHGELFITTVVVFLKRKVPQLNPNISKEEQLATSRLPAQMILLPETVQTILKCLSGSSNLVSNEIQQEIFQMNIQARLLLEKQAQPSGGTGGSSNVLNLQQQQTSSAAAAATIKSLVGASGASGTAGVSATGGNTGATTNTTSNQATFDMIQSMINLNMNPAAAAGGQNPAGVNLNLNQFANSPSKILLSQLNPSLNLQAASSIQSALPNLNTQNLLLNNNANLDNKISMLSNLLNNPQSVRTLNYGSGNPIRTSLNSPQLNIGGNPLEMLDPSKDHNQQQNFYPKEIEEEVEKCIQSLFKANPNAPSLKVDDFVSLLAKLKDSQDKKDNDFYNYALNYIIDANSCLYRLDEMQFLTMSNIWGSLIDRNILSAPLLSQVLKLLLQMMSKSINTRFCIFGIKVLDRCKTRLKDFINFCQCLIQLPNFQQIPSVLKDFIEFGARGMYPPNYTAASLASGQQQPLIPPLTPPISLSNLTTSGMMHQQQQQQQQQQQLINKYVQSALSGNSQLQASLVSAVSSSLSNPNRGGTGAVPLNAKPSIANTTNIETLLIANENDSTHSKPVAPPEQIQDRIGFIFNNLSLSNMQSKGDELKDVLKEEYWDWLAHYLVVKRVSIEPNFHALYSQFIDTMKKECLHECILTETYRNIKVLLRSDKNDQKFSDRALLKNLGSWLGLITLAKGRPILHRDIDIKSLVIEAFQKGQAELLFVVPFVAKVLEPAGKSKVFQPPNPWLLSMLSVLVELHNEPDLKLNHKFEIEVLCKNLNLNIAEIMVRGALRSCEVIEEQLTKVKASGDTKSVSGETTTSSSSSATQSVGANAVQTQLLSASQQQQQQQAHLQQAMFSQHQQQQQDMGDLQQMQVAAAAAAAVAAAAAASQAQNAQPVAASAAYVPPVNPPKYKLSDIKLQSLQNNSNLIYINPDIPLLNAQPTLKNFIVPALDKAVNDMMTILLEKAVKISVNTAEPIIKKDFSLDPEESHMRVAARNMVANMSSGMMLITGKEPLTNHLFNTLKAQFTQPLSPELANTYKDLINQACGCIVQDNIELCMCFLQKNAIQRSIIELERKLQMEFESRSRSRAEGRVHYDPSILTYHQEKMPEMIRLRVGSISPQQFSVYEEFGRNLPGFKMNVEDRAAAAAAAQPNFTQVAEEMNVHYDNLITLLRNELTLMPASGGAMQQLTLNLQSLILAVHDFKVTQQPNSAYALVKKLITNLLEGYTFVQNELALSAQQQQQPSLLSLADPLFLKYRDCNLSVMKVILGDQRFCVNNWILREVQKIWLECSMDTKYSVEGLAILFKYKLLSPQIVDTSLAQFVETGNQKAIQIATQFLRFFYIENASAYIDVQLVTLLESISRVSTISRFVQQNADLRDLIEIIRMNYDSLDSEVVAAAALGGVMPPVAAATASNNRIYATALSMMYTGVTQARDFDDPPNLKEKSEQLLHEWIQHHFILPQKENQKAFQQFVLQMNSQGLFKTDDMITRFFRICTETCVETCYFNLAKGQRQLCYQRLDAFVKLIILLVRHSGDPTHHANKINLFNKVLGLIAGCLLFDHETKLSQFEPMPFHRLFYMLLFEATLPENNLEPIMYFILQAFVNVFHIVRPTKVPGFAYSWLELVSHRLFMSKMLAVSGGGQQQQSPTSLEQNYKSWNMYATLLCQLVKFLAPFLRNIELNQSIMLLYKGTLRLFLVLLHDFPEFLCNSHYQFCDFIPPNCIQLRNLVLSAFPRCMKLPDPLTPNLKVDMIADIDSSPPKISYPYIYNIPTKLKNDLDSYLKTRSPVTFLSDLRSYLQTSPEIGSHYNIQLMNALVMYVGTNGIQALRSKGLTPTHNNLAHAAHSAHSDIFQSLVVYLDSEGRYLFINAVANQLRYPNSHTHYFGCALLNLFAEANSEAIQEQITRVLLERLIVNRPHPWGLLVTFIELIKNPQFKFWNHQFVHCAPEIEKKELHQNKLKTTLYNTAVLLAENSSLVT